MKINSLIFRELVRRGYSLEGKTRIWNIADSKLGYLTPEQARTYLEVTSSKDYKSKAKPQEFILMERHAEEIQKHVNSPSLNVIDLGCGDGSKAAFWIKKFQNRNKVRYFPIDISSYMVDSALKTIHKLDIAEIIEVAWNISDFENLQNVARLFDKSLFKNNLFLLQGNTLSNFDIHELLYEIKLSMHVGDFLLIGNGLYNYSSDQEIVDIYKNNKGFERFFSYIPLQLGLSKEDISFDIRFRHSRVEFYFVLKQDITVTFQDKPVHFKKGDQIVVGIFYRYTREQFLDYLKMYFKMVDMKVSDDGRYTLALCQK